MPGFMPGIHAFLAEIPSRRGWPGQARPWRKRASPDLRDQRLV